MTGNRLTDPELARIDAALELGPPRPWANGVLVRMRARLHSVEWERDQLRTALSDAGFSAKVTTIARAAEHPGMER